METKYKIHSFYILFILLAVIVLLVSIRWGEIPTLVQYFSFALTLSSLLLAVLAIIYSFYSSNASSQNILVLSNLSSQMAQSASQLGVLTAQISAEIGKVPEHLLLVKDKVEETKSLIKEYYSTQPSKKPEDHTKPTPELIDNFLSQSSFMGLEVIYACSLALSNKKPYVFNFDDFSEKTAAKKADYSFGFLVACSSLALLKGHGSRDSYNISSIDSRLDEKIKPRLLKAANEKEEPTKSIWLANIQTIENYFVVGTAGAT